MTEDVRPGQSLLGDSPSPAFGQADLSNCEREQIEHAASIQPHGALLVVREPDLAIVQASANAKELLGFDQELVGWPLNDLGGGLADRIRPHLNDPLNAIPLVLRARVGRSEQAFDLLLHRPRAGGLVIELEPAGPAMDFSRQVHEALGVVVASASLRHLCDETARFFKEITGYDRVMVYRFDEAGHGEVFSERCEPELESYLGNHYPGSDIPQIARRLYERHRIRLLVDVDYTPVPLVPRLSPLTGEDLDMSLCSLRSMSPIHIQYLKNMGVKATLVASLLVGGRLWGLVACHHRSSRHIQYEIRAVCELLAEAVATRIAALESFVQAQAELAVRRLEQRMIESIARDGDWTTALIEHPQSLLQPVEAAGAAIFYDGNVFTTGEVPGTQELREIGAWLDQQPRMPVIATASLANKEPRFASLKAVASGILATPISNCAGEYLLWLRPEQMRTMTWGGNPFKPADVGKDPSQLSPRRSFTQWHQVVEGTSIPWTSASRAAARLIGESVTDVVQQFRSVRVLIAQAQLAQVRSQVRIADQPILITDSEGSVLLVTQSLERLLGSESGQLACLDDLVALLCEPPDAAQRLEDLMAHYRPWRGEICLMTPLAEVPGQAALPPDASKGSPASRPVSRPPPEPVNDRCQPRCGIRGGWVAQRFLLRADPVFSSPDRVLGFVFLLTDLTSRKAAEDARHRFQAGILEQQKLMRQPLSSHADPLYRDLLSAIVGNAQLAALEVADGLDLTRVPAMVDGVKTSVSRTAELLEHLVWYAGQSNDGRNEPKQ